MKLSKKYFPTNRLLQLVAVCLYAILILVPFHGLISVLIESHLHNELIAKTWKEFLLLFATTATVLDMSRQRDQAKKFLARRLHQLIIVYAVYHVVLFAILQPPALAALVAMLVNVRFLVLFMVARWFIQRLSKPDYASMFARVTMLSLGVLIATAFIKDYGISLRFWESLGYGSETLPVRYTLDDNQEITRASGFTRGPNVLAMLVALFSSGIYARILVQARTASSFRSFMWRRASVSNVVILGVAITVLLLSYSRSGLLAFIIQAVGLTVLALSVYWRRRFLGASLLVGTLIAIGLFSQIGSSSLVRTLILHDDPETGGVSSTTVRFEANQVALESVIDNPIGEGPGTAGPASFYSDTIRIAENYYLQIAQEVGLFGLLLFLTICVLVFQRLYRQKDEFWPRILLVSFVGISVAGMFMHVWADDEVALVWWGLAGLFVRD